MSVALSARLKNTGTRFKVFPQPRFLDAFAVPEVVTVTPPPGQIGAGPSDNRMYVIDALDKQPYSTIGRPPFGGSTNAPVTPGPGGHFDHLDPDSRAFSCAAMYATVRFCLDIWEDYFGRFLDWHFVTHFPRLELIPLIEWNNAQSGYGFLEFGYAKMPNGALDFTRPHCQNFDVLAHEFGHSLVFSTVGAPRSSADLAVDYRGMHESAGDLVALVGALHFDAVIDHLLDNTQGNLFSSNELSRVGELSRNRQVRVAFNYLRMSDVSDEPHLRSLPLTGGIFDVLVEVFQKELVERGLISNELARKSTNDVIGSATEASLQREFARAYAGHEAGFKDALLAARDYIGGLLAKTWSSLSPNFLTYHEVLRTLMRADRDLTAGKHQETLRSAFSWREIDAPMDSPLFALHRLHECVPEDPHIAIAEPVERVRKRRSTKRKAPAKARAPTRLKTRKGPSATARRATASRSTTRLRAE